MNREIRLREIDLPKSLSKDIAKAEIGPGSSCPKAFALPRTRAGPTGLKLLLRSKMDKGT